MMVCVSFNIFFREPYIIFEYLALILASFLFRCIEISTDVTRSILHRG